MMSNFRICKLLPEHASAVFPHLHDASYYRFIPGAPPASVEALAERYAKLCAGCPDGSETWLNWLMFAEQEVVGTLQATLFPAGLAVIGYTVFPPFWRRSFAGTGVAWLVRELFAKHAVARIDAFVDARNEASIRLLQRLGFTESASADAPQGDRVFALLRA